MTTYKEQIEGREYFVLLENCNVIGTFGNLKKVFVFMEGKDFAKYNTIVRKKEWPQHYKKYSIWKVKHY